MNFCKNPTFLISFLFLIGVSFSSCVKEQEPPVDLSKGAYEKGVFVVNEGAFQDGTGTISFFKRDFATIENEIFQKENASALLGNIVQSMFVHQEKAYILVNNANKAEVVDANTFESEATIADLELPRYMVADGNKGYISYWGDGFNGGVAVLDLTNHTITKTIPTGAGAEGMVIQNNKLYVANSGGYGNDSTLAVIDLTTQKVVNSIVVGDNPISLASDKNGAIWAFGRGYSDWNDPTLNTLGALVKIENDEIKMTLPIENGFGNKMAINGAGDFLYLNTDSKIYVQEISEMDFSSTAFTGRGYYGIGVDPESGNVFCADAKDFSSRGEVTIFDPTGTELKKMEVGIIPNGFVFR